MPIYSKLCFTVFSGAYSVVNVFRIDEVLGMSFFAVYCMGSKDKLQIFSALLPMT